MVKFESDFAHLAEFFGNSEILASSNLPFKIRHDSLFFRCRLITLEESARICRLLENLGKTSQHMTTLFQGLRDMTITQAFENTINIQSSIAECEAQSLKRLEVELRLIQLSFHIILTTLGNTSHVDVKASLEKVRVTCTEYPDTAGIFFPMYRSYKISSESMSPTKEFDSKDGREFWRLWGRHEIGHVKYCLFGHPFSSKTFSDCPECGRQVEKEPKGGPINYNKFLHENAFLEQMLKMKIKA